MKVAVPELKEGRGESNEIPSNEIDDFRNLGCSGQHAGFHVFIATDI
jgi:hypothetical protein